MLDQVFYGVLRALLRQEKLMLAADAGYFGDVKMFKTINNCYTNLLNIVSLCSSVLSEQQKVITNLTITPYRQDNINLS